MLVNDGYGCGYGEGPTSFPQNLSDLTYVIAELHKRGMYAGLWTSTGMPNIAAEVGTAGSRVCKTDVSSTMLSPTANGWRCDLSGWNAT
jgi:alpha-glucosidase